MLSWIFLIPQSPPIPLIPNTLLRLYKMAKWLLLWIICITQSFPGKNRSSSIPPNPPITPTPKKYTKALQNGQMVFAVCYLCKGSWTWITVIIPLVLAMPGSHPIGIFIGFPISLPFCLRLGSHLCPRWIILLCLFHIYDVINSITCTRELF